MPLLVSSDPTLHTNHEMKAQISAIKSSLVVADIDSSRFSWSELTALGMYFLLNSRSKMKSQLKNPTFSEAQDFQWDLTKHACTWESHKAEIRRSLLVTGNGFPNSIWSSFICFCQANDKAWTTACCIMEETLSWDCLTHLSWLEIWHYINWPLFKMAWTCFYIYPLPTTSENITDKHTQLFQHRGISHSRTFTIQL